MATRRVLMALLALLVLSTLAAALVPLPERSEVAGTTGKARTRPEAASTGSARRGRTIRASIRAGSERLRTVRARSGDQLLLRVDSDQLGEVEIPGFGLVRPVAPGSPASFDLLASRPGRYDILVSFRRGPIGRIVVSGCCRRSRTAAGTSRSR